MLDVDDNCPRNANADQEDVDRDGIGDVCDPEIAVECGPGKFYEPITQPPGATVASGTEGICVACSVVNANNVIDANLNNAAPDHRAGDDRQRLHHRDQHRRHRRALPRAEARRRRGRESGRGPRGEPDPEHGDHHLSRRRPAESSEDVGSGNVQTLGVAGQPSKLILDFPTTENFDAARISFSNTAGTQSALDVYAICVGEP